MAKTYLGIEIGSQAVKFAVCTEDRVKEFFVEKLPDNIVRDGSIVSWEVMTSFIKEKIKAHRTACKDVAMVLPEGTTYVRRFLMPYMTVEQMKVNLPYEFRDYITEEKDKYVYDYAVLEIVEEEHNGQKSKSMDIMAVAVLKETIEKYKNMLKRCGLKLRVAAPETCSYQNIVRKHTRLHATEEVGDYAIVDIGHNTVDLRIFTKGKYETGREIEPGLKAITQVISDTLSVDEHIAEIYKLSNQNNILYSEECMSVYSQIGLEVSRVINFFTYNYPNNTLDTLYVCGGGAKVEPLVEALRGIIDLKVKGLDELFDGTVANEDALALGATAVGITWN